MVGTTLSRYEILGEISRGGMGVVYRARDTRSNREVALKVLPPELVADPDRKRRFVQEAQSAAGLKHPHIATIYEIGEAEPASTFIAMELIDGRKLADLLDARAAALHARARARDRRSPTGSRARTRAESFTATSSLPT